MAYIPAEAINLDACVKHIKSRDCRFVAVRDIDRNEKKNGDVPVARATPKYHLTLQLSIPKGYPTHDWVRGTVAVAIGHQQLCWGDGRVELRKQFFCLAIGWRPAIIIKVRARVQWVWL